MGRKMANKNENKNQIEIKELEDRYEIFVNYAFETTAPITERTILVSSAYGLGLDEAKNFKLYDNCKFQVKKADIVLVNGDSGSGKSWILENVFKKIEGAISMSDIKIANDEVVIEGIGKDLNDALMKLNIAGLGDAFLYLRKYSQLSDGQKYRYKIAKLLDCDDKDIWILDEFCATLSRTQAQIISFNLQKIARKLGKTIIVATTHTDLFDHIRPNLHIVKGFGSDVSTGYYDDICWKDKKLDILNDITIEEGSSLDYSKLKDYHYRQAHLPAVKKIYRMLYRDKLIGVMVISYPHLTLKARNIYTGNAYAKMSKENCDRLNADFECIARVIIDPVFRGIGLAHYFVEQYLEKFAQTKYVETISVLSTSNPFFEKAGMVPIPVGDDVNRLKSVKRLEQFGYDVRLLSSARYNESIYDTLTDEQKEAVKNIVKSVLKKYKGQIPKLFSQDKNIDKVVDENLFELMKELLRNRTLYLVKKMRD